MRKKFLVQWQSNYGNEAAIVYALDIDEAKSMCDKSDLVWDGYDIEEIMELNYSLIVFLTK